MKNIKAILADATKYPAAIEAKLPAGAPKISTMLGDFASKLPAIPDLPVDLPALPAPPALPEMPTGAGLRRFVTGVEVIPVQQKGPGSSVTPLEQSYTQPIEGVIGTVVSRRGM